MILTNVTFSNSFPLPQCLKTFSPFVSVDLSSVSLPYLQVWTSIVLLVNKGFLTCLTCPVPFFFDAHNCGQDSPGGEVQPWAEQFSPAMDNSQGRTQLGSVSGPNSQQWGNVFFLLKCEVWTAEPGFRCESTPRFLSPRFYRECTLKERPLGMPHCKNTLYFKTQ